MCFSVRCRVPFVFLLALHVEIDNTEINIRNLTSADVDDININIDNIEISIDNH